MRSVHVINGLGPGGAEQSLAEIVRNLPDYGVRPTVACFQHQAEGVEQLLVRAGVDVRFLEDPRPAGRVRELRRLIGSVGADVVHTTIFEADVLGRLAAWRVAPVLTSIVNPSYAKERLAADPNLRRHRLRGAQVIDAVTARLMTARFHAITEAVKVAAIHDLHLNPADIAVVPRGRDVQRLGDASPQRRAVVRESLGVAATTPVMLNTGRREYQKGQTHLLAAAAFVRRARPDVRWFIAGREGNASESLRERHRQLELDASVLFLGYRDDVPDLIAAADVFIFPSLFEGLGGAVIEAMALGLPVIASDIPAVREVLDGGRCGVLVPPGEPRPLANAVLALLDDEPRRTQLATAASERFHQRYTLEQMVSGMAALLKETAALA